jgi:hypothetical protein
MLHKTVLRPVLLLVFLILLCVIPVVVVSADHNTWPGNDPTNTLVVARTWHVATTGSDSTGDGSEVNPFATIQHGIDVASHSDTVLVQPGVYRENLNFKGKNITIGSFFLTTGNEDYILQTVIDGQRNGSVVLFVNGEAATAQLSGFTITNGYAVNTPPSGANGGGVYCLQASPTLSHLRVIGNEASGEGGGVYLAHCAPTIRAVEITRNRAGTGGGGIRYSSGSVNLENVVVAHNTALTGGSGIFLYHANGSIKNALITDNTGSGKGGGVVLDASSPTLVNVTLAGNRTAGQGGAINVSYNSQPTLVNTIVWGNTPQPIYFDTDWPGQAITIAYSDIQGGQAGIVTNGHGPIHWGAGNLDASPRFRQPGLGNYRLDDSSPAIGAGTAAGAPDTDLDGFPRPYPPQSNPDLGPYENVTPFVSAYQISKSVSTDWADRGGRADLGYGDTVSFTIRITNTGETWITTLPLRDVYDPAYLSYGSCGSQHTANPLPNDYLDDGQLDWRDLTAPAPYGFGTDLAPGASFIVVITFTAAYPTYPTPTENSATIHNAKADPDGPGGVLLEIALPEKTSSAAVSIWTFPALPILSGVVWHDSDRDGETNSGVESGIGGVAINVYRDDGDAVFEPVPGGDAFIGTTHTAQAEGNPNAHGLYAIFLPLDPGHSCHPLSPLFWVDVADRNSALGGVLEGMYLTSDQTYGPDPSPAFQPRYWLDVRDINFGYARLASIASPSRPEIFRVGQPISLSFQITHTGESQITTLPLTVNYDPSYLDYQRAQPPADDNVNDGEITWHNVITSTSRASVASLSSEGDVTVVITFTGVADTGSKATPITATVQGAYIDPDGAGGSLPAQPFSFTTTSGVTVHVPTGLNVSHFTAEARENHVRITWQTVNEANVLGFNVLRQATNDSQFQMMNNEPLLAQRSGSNTGARYTYEDEKVVPGTPYRYKLIVIKLDGSSEEIQPDAPLRPAYRLFHPRFYKAYGASGLNSTLSVQNPSSNGFCG